MRVLIFVGLFLSFSVQALKLPNPLTLGYTLTLAKNLNLDEKQQQINIELNEIELKSYQDNYEPTFDIDLQLAGRDNQISSNNYSHGFVKINKLLFDQNTQIAQYAANNQLKSAKFTMKQIQDNKILQVMRAFFNIILADMRYQTTLERLALSAVRADHVQDDFDVQDASEVELLEKQALTQLDVSKRIEDAGVQITTRAKLAQLLNIDYENRPDDLVRPDFTHLFAKKLAEFEFWQKKIQLNNPQLKELKRVLVSLKQQQKLEMDNREITINSTLRLGKQKYDIPKNGEWRAGLNIIVPLGQNYAQERKIAKLLAKIKQQELLIKKHRQNLNQQTLSLWTKLRTFKQLNTALTTELDYRDLYLERARANYEMEIENYIGDAMGNLTDTEWKLAKNEFDFVLTLTQLQQLAGEDYAF